MRAHVLCFRAAHEAGSELAVVCRELCEEVATMVLLIARAVLSRIRARVPHVPHVAEQVVRVHFSPHTADSRGAKPGHDRPIECAYTLELGARDGQANERRACQASGRRPAAP
eukprot:scaffold19217_cov117-Isochrysis_galbana.AAC.6